jgi:hypothetical protein
MLHCLQKYYMLYLTICTYNITFLIVVMVVITVCYLLGTLSEGVEVYRKNLLCFCLQPVRGGPTGERNVLHVPSLARVLLLRHCASVTGL